MGDRISGGIPEIDIDMDESKSIVLVLPAYNEATAIGQVISRIPARICSMNVTTIVVDDGSSDQTAEVARIGGARVIRHLTNLGVGAATRTGLRAAEYLGAQVVVTLDADGQHDPGDIERLVLPILNEGLDVVIGNRLTQTGMPVHRRAANLVMNLVTFVVYGRFVPDSQSGFKAISRAGLRAMELRSAGYEVCSEIIGEIVSKNLKHRFVPIRPVYTPYSRSKGQHFLNGINIIIELFSRMLRRV